MNEPSTEPAPVAPAPEEPVVLEPLLPPQDEKAQAELETLKDRHLRLVSVNPSFFSPKRAFFLLAQSIAFDVQVLVNWLLSVETCFLSYLTR